MRIDLRKIADNPGESVAFSCDLDTGDLDFDQITAYAEKPHAEGQIRNTAGILELKGALKAPMTCRCDRCGEEFSYIKEMDLDAVISEDESELENPDIFPMEDCGVDVDDIVRTLFVLGMETKFLCRPDCKGLCPTCGKNLNEGPCNCKKEMDPRMAVLEQLLDNKEIE